MPAPFIWTGPWLAGDRRSARSRAGTASPAHGADIIRARLGIVDVRSRRTKRGRCKPRFEQG